MAIQDHCPSITQEVISAQEATSTQKAISIQEVISAQEVISTVDQSWAVVTGFCKMVIATPFNSRLNSDSNPIWRFVNTIQTS